MAIVKLSKSGKAILFIDERGFVYSFPRKKLAQFITRANSRQHFRSLSLMPFRTNPDQYPHSDIYIDGESYSIDKALEEDVIRPEFVELLLEDGNDMIKEEHDKSNEKSQKEVPSDVEVDW